ncbi:MAG: HTTM domain-containing protein [Bryobacterales bacterium]|nr:HTTM domain-containing protein [Bryobacterales bacterium]
MLADLFARVLNLKAHYTDAGIFPRAALIGDFIPRQYSSLFFVNGTWWFAALLFAVAAVSAMAFTLGYRTRWAAAVSWVLAVSMQTRSPLIGDAGDTVLRLLLFWSLFASMGAVWSIDSWRPQARRPHRVHVSAGSIGLMLQMASIFFFAALLKSGKEWHGEMSAVYYALNLDAFATGIGIWLRQFEELGKLLTVTTMIFEGVVVWLLFSPWWNGPLRTLVSFLFVGLHASFGLTMALGVFPFIMAAGWLLFLPEWFWEKLARRWPALAIPEASAEPEPWNPREPWQLLGLALVLYTVTLNIRELNPARFDAWAPRGWPQLGFVSRLDQRWDMFAPYPLKDDGWYLIPGKLKNGEDVDLATGGGVVFRDKPDDVAAHYRTQRWRKYLINLWAAENSGYRVHFARYLCRSWNDAHAGGEVLDSLDLVFMREETPPMGHPFRSPVPTRIHSHRCSP